MFYIHQSACISPQQTFGNIDLNELKVYNNNQMLAIEPKYEGIPPGQLRRMGKALRMGVGSGMSLLKSNKVDGIIVGTANGGIEDSISFLNQIEEYQEGRLTPTHFVQSTFNAIAGIMGLITQNKGYNATHVHRGAAFENVALDAAMLLKENQQHQYLIGAVDEISVRNYRMEALAGWYKKEMISSNEMFKNISEGMIPGEGAAMFIVNNIEQSANAKLSALHFFVCHHIEQLLKELETFLLNNKIEKSSIDLLMSGYNADERFIRFYETIEAQFENKPICRFKKLTGDFQTVSALATWLSVQLLHTRQLPHYWLHKECKTPNIRRILIYNNYRGEQHSFMLIEKP
jgi:hypothetical protein